MQRHHRIHTGRPDMTILVQTMGLSHQSIKTGLISISSPITEDRAAAEQTALEADTKASVWGRYVRTPKKLMTLEERTKAHEDWKASVEVSAEAWADFARLRFEDDEKWQDQLLGLEACNEDGIYGDVASQVWEMKTLDGKQNGEM
jgi:hypothetical protein